MLIAETEVGSVKYRISRQDEMNIILERFDPPHLGKRGRSAGKMTQGRWVILGYYGTAQAAAKNIVSWGVAQIPGSFQDVIFTLNELERKFERKFNA